MLEAVQLCSLYGPMAWTAYGCDPVPEAVCVSFSETSGCGSRFNRCSVTVCVPARITTFRTPSFDWNM